MSRSVVLRPLLGLLTAGLLGVVAAAPGEAYGGGPANWQIAVAGTATTPGVGGFGFWGWCEFSGGVSSGNSGDCQITQYVHQVHVGDLNCHQSINVTSWFVSATTGDFVAGGTSTTVPARAAPLCILIGGVPPSFPPADLGVPAAAGHYNLTSFLLSPGSVGEFQIQVTQVG